MKWSLGEVMRTTLAAAAVAGCAATGALIFVSSRLNEAGEGAVATAALSAGDVTTIGAFALGAGTVAVGLRVLAQRRRPPRPRRRLPGALITPDGEFFIRAENISLTGARMFVGEMRLVEGKIYPIRLGAFETKAEVRWVQGRRVGMAFADELSARALERLLASGRSLLSVRPPSASSSGRSAAAGAEDGAAPPTEDLSFSAPAMPAIAASSPDAAEESKKQTPGTIEADQSERASSVAG